MLNLRDPGINEYSTEFDNTCGFPPSTEPVPLTTVVVTDMPTLQMGEEAQSVSKFLHLCCVVHRLISAFQVLSISKLCHGSESMYID